MPKPKKQKLDRFHYHEVLDRTVLIMDLVGGLIAHPVAVENPAIGEELMAILNRLGHVASYPILWKGAAKVRGRSGKLHA